MNIQLIHIQQLDTRVSAVVERPAESKEYEYKGLAIEEDGKFYYWAKGVGFEISEQEYVYIKANPKIYYFSTALRFHLRIQLELQANKNKTDLRSSKGFDVDTVPFATKGNYEDQNEYITLEKVRIMLNSNIERRLRLSDGKIYHFAYGFFGPDYSGVISEDVYGLMKDSVVFDVVGGGVIRRKTGEKIRKLED